MCLKAMITAEVIACNVFEDLFSSFSSLYCALANYFCALNFFSSLEDINLHIWFILS